MCSTLQIEHSRSESWPRSLCCALGQDTSLSQYSFHLNSIQVYNWTSAKLMLVVVVLGAEGVGREWYPRNFSCF